MIDFRQIAAHGGNKVSPDELELLYNTAMKRMPKTIVEIGAYNGCSTVTLGLLAKQCKGKLYSIEPVIRKGLIENMKRYQLNGAVEHIQEYSPWVTSWTPAYIDYLFIDGEHTTICAILDFGYWSKYMNKGDLVAFHDVNTVGIRTALEIIIRERSIKQIAAKSRIKVFEMP